MTGESFLALNCQPSKAAQLSGLAASSFIGRVNVHGDRDAAAFVGLERTYTDDFACHLFAAIVADRDDDGVFPAAAAFRMPKVSFNRECGEGGLGALLCNRLRIET